MAATCEWREHDGVPYLFLCPAGPGREQLAELIHDLSVLLREEPPGLVRLLIDLRPLGRYVPAPGELAEYKRIQREMLQTHTFRSGLVGVSGINAAVMRGMSAMSGRITLLGVPTLERGIEFVARDAH
jgi:hypothetical protein